MTRDQALHVETLLRRRQYLKDRLEEQDELGLPSSPWLRKEIAALTFVLELVGALDKARQLEHWS